MKLLHLLRHAKSDRSDPGMKDAARPLNGRGRAAAPRMAQEMRRLGIAADVVLCSSAIRTRETWDLIKPVLFPAGRAKAPAVRVLDELYLAGARDMLKIVRQSRKEIGSVLLIGHNPGIEQLAARLAGPGSDEEALARLRDDYPTCALASFAFDTPDWTGATEGKGVLLRYLVPRDLE